MVHIAYEDALAYARWAHKRLPTEAEFEWAARMANVFQGQFPHSDSGADGWRGIAPVSQLASRGVVSNPLGPESSFDPDEPGVAKRVQRGGSFLCSQQFCSRFLVGARGRGEPSTGTTHVGFRCAQ